MTTDIKVQVREILAKYDLDFRIEKLPSVALRKGMGVDANGDFVEVLNQVKTPYFMLYNDKSGEIINSVKKGYTVSQNDDIYRIDVRGC